AQNLPVADAAEATGAHHEEEAQRPHAAQDVGVGPLATPRLGGGERVELEATQQIVRQDAELLPGAVGAVVVGGHDIEGKLALELGERLLLGAPGGDGRVLEVAVVGREEIELEVLTRVSCWTGRR